MGNDEWCHHINHGFYEWMPGRHYQFHSLIVVSYSFKEIPLTLNKNKPQEDSQRVGLSRDTACTVLTGSCVPSLWRVTFPGRNKRYFIWPSRSHLEIGPGCEGGGDDREEARGVAPGEVVVVGVQEVVSAPAVGGENLTGEKWINLYMGSDMLARLTLQSKNTFTSRAVSMNNEAVIFSVPPTARSFLSNLRNILKFRLFHISRDE